MPPPLGHGPPPAVVPFEEREDHVRVGREGLRVTDVPLELGDERLGILACFAPFGPDKPQEGLDGDLEDVGISAVGACLVRV